MKKILLSFFIVALCISTVGAEKFRNCLIIENYLKEKVATSEKWWKFGSIKVSDMAKNGKNFIKIKGQAKDWFVGGMGTYLAKDAAAYNVIEIDILGSGSKSGKIKLELVEDDIGSPEVQADPKTFLPLKQDKYISPEISANWEGWRTVTVDIKEFVLANSGAGDGSWNPSTDNGHYGLLHFQMIFLATSADGMIDLGIGDIKMK